MAVDLSVGNAVIQAFMAGHQQAQEKLRLKTQTEQQKAELEERKKEHEEQIKFQQEQLKQQGEHFKSTQAFNQSLHDLAVIEAKQKIGGNIETPEEISQIGGKITGTQYDQTGQYPTSIQFSHPLLGENLSVEHPEARTFRKVQETEALEGPKRKTQQELESLRSFGDYQQRLLQETQTNERAKLERESRERMNAATNAARIEAARKRGESDKTIQQAISLKSRFETNKLVTDFNIVKAQRDFAQNVTASGPNDTSLIAAYVKATDPNRVTESEFDIAARSGQSLAQRFGFKLENLTSGKPEFLSPEARKAMIDTIEQRYKAHENMVKNYAKETDKSFKMIGSDSKNWLPDFTATSARYEVGEIVPNPTDPSKKVKITKVFPDGTFDGDDIDANVSEEPTKINQDNSQGKLMGETVAKRHNNPLNIKVGAATKNYIDNGLATIGEKSTDGGNFLKFKDSDTGYQAAMSLLNSNVYKDLTLDEAMKKWSNKGYGANVVEGIPATKKIKDLNFAEKAKLISAMAKREGYSD